MRQLVVQDFHHLAHIVGQRLDLPVAVAGAQDEEIGDNVVAPDPLRAQVEQNDVLSLLVFEAADDVSCDLQRIQNSPPLKRGPIALSAL